MSLTVGIFSQRPKVEKCPSYAQGNLFVFVKGAIDPDGEFEEVTKDLKWACETCRRVFSQRKCIADITVENLFATNHG